MNEQNPVNQNDVAKLAGVSRSVVSYVLNNGPRKVSAETRKRVLEAIETLGYRPNEHAQRLKQGNDAIENVIGIVTGGVGYNLLERPYYNMILSGLYETAYQLNQQIGFISYWDALKDPIFFNKHVHPQEISSLIFILPSLIPNTEHDQRLLEEIVGRIPYIVCLEESIMDIPSVTFDRAQAAKTVMNHLIQLGHERIAFIAIDDQRVEGYKQALLENNLSYAPELVSYLSHNPAESGYENILNWLDSGVTFSAVFAATDEAAISAIAALKDRGLRVPEDVAVASIDNIDMASMVRPALTTIDVPKRTLARLTIQSLQTQKTFSDQKQLSLVVPTTLIIRDSCGAHLT
jgi:LacI family transcriptional regulator